MIKGIEAAQVYDPALVDLESEAIPSRIELVVSPSLNLETITHEKESMDWIVYHYGRFMKIEPSNLSEDWEVADFNTSGDFPEAVVPVSVVIESQAGNYLEDYYVRFTEARQILDSINEHPGFIERTGGRYTLVANEAWAKQKKVAFRIQHTRHACIRCMRQYNTTDAASTPVGRPIEVAPKRFVDLCDRHMIEQRGVSSARRLEIAN